MMAKWLQLKTNLENIRDHFRPSVYRKIGGRSKISKLVDSFYQIMQTDPLARDCLLAHPHPDDLKIPALKLKHFLSGWLGGPQLYLQKYGHPRMRMRHMKFPIGETEREQWLYCMNKAMSENKIPEHIQSEIIGAMRSLAEVIQNRP